ncbi:MAG: hypothetical protein HQ477_03680 [Chloroflexi bacterium]|nr:hypothetical protein [Chloroflexota bacterium]
MLCLIFAELAEESAELITGRNFDAGRINGSLVDKAIRQVEEEYKGVDPREIRLAVVRFFSEPDHRFSALKAHLAQSYFTMKVFGVDPSGEIFSRSVFENTVIYLDTNVLIDGIAPSQGVAASVEAFITQSRNLGVQIRVLDITIEELKKFRTVVVLK